MTNTEVDAAATPYRLSWPALFGGIFAASGLWLLLHVLGLALGLSTLDPSSPGTLRAVGIGSGIWSILASVIALFVGGAVTAHTAGVLGRDNAAVHGLVLWGAVTILGLVVAQSVAGAMMSGAAKLGSAATSGAKSLPDAARALGIDSNDMLQPINARLQANGKPQLTAQQLQGAVDDAVQTSVGRGELDYDAILAAVSRRTGLSQADLRQTLSSTQHRLEDNMRAAAERTTQVARGLSWTLFALMALSFAASIVGAITGLSRRQRELSDQVRTSGPLMPATRTVR